MKRDHDNAVRKTEEPAAVNMAAHQPAGELPRPLVDPLGVPTKPAAEAAAAPHLKGSPQALWFWAV